MHKFQWTTIFAALLLAAPAVGQAQFGDPEAGDTGGWAPPAQPQQPAAQPQQPAAQPAPPPAQPQQPAWFQRDQERPPSLGGGSRGAAPGAASGNSDHAKVLDAIGIEYLGTSSMSFLAPDGSSDRTMRRSLATAGVRMWLNETTGLDLGVMFGYAAPTVNQGGDFVFSATGFGLGLHLGIPFAMAVYEHATFLMIPEARIGFGSLSYLGTAEDGSQDWSASTFQFDLGLRAGTEIQLGFWGIPQVAVQMTVGLGFQYVSQSAEMVENRDVNFDQSALSLTSTANDVFDGTVRVIYYWQ